MSNTDEDFMTDTGDRQHTKPIGVFVTLKEIHTTVLAIADKLDDEVGKLKSEISTIKAQLAAQWVIQGIQVTVIIYLVQKGIG